MKNIQEIKNEVAVKHGFNIWLDILGLFSTSTDISYLKLIELENEAMQEYAKQCCDEQIKVIAEKLIKECKSKILGDQLYSDVLNTPNVVTTK